MAAGSLARCPPADRLQAPLRLVTICTHSVYLRRKINPFVDPQGGSMGFSDSHHFRKTVAGWCMVFGPLVALVAFIVSPAIKTDAAAQLAVVSLHQDRFLLSTLLTLLAVALVIGGALGFMHMLRERMVAFGHVGGLLSGGGLLAARGGRGA